jgi:hypothetical protein
MYDSDTFDSLCHHMRLYAIAFDWYRKQRSWLPMLYNTPIGAVPPFLIMESEYHYYDNDDTPVTSPEFHHATALLLAINRLHILTHYGDMLHDVENNYTDLDFVYELDTNEHGHCVLQTHDEFTDIIRCTDLDEMTARIRQLMEDPSSAELLEHMKDISADWWEQSELSWTITDDVIVG